MNVYGTLKRGCWNHDRFCRGVLDVQEAVVRGRLYELSSGIHVQQVPEEDILAHGTADPLADLSACNAQAGVATQAHLSDRVGLSLKVTPESATAGGWGLCRGNCSPLTCLRRGFGRQVTPSPACPPSTAWRASTRAVPAVLAPVYAGKELIPAWLYVGEEVIKRRLAPLGNSLWL